MDKQTNIRRNLHRQELLCNTFHGLFNKAGQLEWTRLRYLHRYNFFMSRRRFFIKELIRVQLKEFDRV